MTYRSTATIAELAARVSAAGRLMVTGHEKPDGDTLGSCLALQRALSAEGKIVDMFVSGPLEPGLVRVIGTTPYFRVEECAPGHDYDLAIIVDTGAWSQLGTLEAWLRANRDRVVGLDHHSHGDDIASARVVDTRQASAAQLVLKLLDELGCTVTPGIDGVAEALFVGVATDTGWFRYANADAEAFRVASRLLELDVDKSRLFQIIEETGRPSRLELEARALASVEYACDGAAAVMSLGPRDFEETGGNTTDLTSLVNRPMQVERVRVSVLLSEADPGRTKVSLRSKPAIGGGKYVDVNEVAQRLGGGGHVHAAGARVEKPLAEAKRVVVAALEGA